MTAQSSIATFPALLVLVFLVMYKEMFLIIAGSLFVGWLLIHSARKKAEEEAKERKVSRRRNNKKKLEKAMDMFMFTASEKEDIKECWNSSK